MANTSNGTEQSSKARLASIVVKIDQKAYRRFRLKAVKDGTTVSSVIRALVKEYCEE